VSDGILTGYSDKIMERKTVVRETNTLVTPVSYSMKKKPGVSTEKYISVNQTAMQINQKNVLNEIK
jgi:hypothetical protein